MAQLLAEHVFVADARRAAHTGNFKRLASNRPSELIGHRNAQCIHKPSKSGGHEFSEWHEMMLAIEELRGLVFIGGHPHTVVVAARAFPIKSIEYHGSAGLCSHIYGGKRRDIQSVAQRRRDRTFGPHDQIKLFSHGRAAAHSYCAIDALDCRRLRVTHRNRQIGLHQTHFKS